MKIHEWNEMNRWLTRPATPTSTLPTRQPVVQGGVIGQGGMFQGEDMGYRTGFVEPKPGYKAGFVTSDAKGISKLYYTKKHAEIAEKVYGKTMQELYDANRAIFFNVKYNKVKLTTIAGEGAQVKGNIQIPTKDVRQPDGTIKKIELPVRYPNKTVENKFVKAVKNIFKKPAGVIPFKTLANDHPITERQAVRAAQQVKKQENLKFVKGRTVPEYYKEVRKPLLDISSSPKVEKRMGIERARFLRDQPEVFGKINTAHRASKSHMARLGLQFDTQLVGMDSRLINQVVLKPSENMLEKLYTKREGILDNIKGKPTNEQKKVLKQINDSVRKVIKTTSGRFVGIIVDPNTLEPSFSGIKKDLAFSKVNKTMKEIANLPGTPTLTGGLQGTSLKDSQYFKFIQDNVRKSVSGEIKRGFVPHDFKVILGDPKNRKNLLDYAKKNTPDIFNKFKQILNNPTSKKRFALYSKLPHVALPAGIALSLISDQAKAAETGQMPQGSPGQLSEDEEGLSLQDKAALGTVAVAGAKPAWKYLAKPALKIMGSPAAGLGFAGWSFVDHFNASEADTEEGKVYDALTTGIKFGEGKDEKEILGSQAGIELLFPEVVKQGAKKLGVEFSKKGGKSALAALGRFALNPIGRAASIMTPTGLVLNAAAIAKQYYNFAKDEIGKVEQMKPEDRKAYNEMLMDETYSADAGDYYTSEDVLAGKPVGYDQGGRVGLKDGENVTAAEIRRKERIALAEKVGQYLKFPSAYDEKGNKIPTFSKTGPQQVEDAPEGATSDKEFTNFIMSLDIPITEKIDLLGEFSYGKFREKREYEDKMYLHDPKSWKGQKVGIGYNKEGEGFGGHIKYDIGAGEPEAFIKWSKKFNQGGRVGLKKGSPKDPKRRLVLKGIAYAAALPLVGRFFKVGKLLERGSTYTGPIIEKIKGMPDWVPLAVKRLWNEGEDVTKTASTMDRQVVKRGTLESGDDVDLIYDVGTGNVSIDVTPSMNPKTGYHGHETKSGAFNKEYGLEFTKGEEIATKKGSIKTPDEFKVTETEPVRTGHPEDPDWDWDGTSWDNVDDAITDLTELEAFAKNKTTKQIHKKKGTKPKDVFPEVEFDDTYDLDYDID